MESPEANNASPHSATRPKFKRMKRVQRKTRSGRLVTDVSLQELECRFSMPENLACKELGVGLTVFKRLCRLYNIQRWPFRKLQRLLLIMRRMEHDVGTYQLHGVQELHENSTDRPSLSLILNEFYANLPASSLQKLLTWIMQLALTKPQEEPLRTSIQQLATMHGFNIDTSAEFLHLQPPMPPTFGNINLASAGEGPSPLFARQRGPSEPLNADEAAGPDEDEEAVGDSHDSSAPTSTGSAKGNEPAAPAASMAEAAASPFLAFSSPFMCGASQLPALPSNPFEAMQAATPVYSSSLPHQPWPSQLLNPASLSHAVRTASLPAQEGQEPAHPLPGLLGTLLASSQQQAAGALRNLSLPGAAQGILAAGPFGTQVGPFHGPALYPAPGQGLRHPSLPVEVSALGSRLSLLEDLVSPSSRGPGLLHMGSLPITSAPSSASTRLTAEGSRVPGGSLPRQLLQHLNASGSSSLSTIGLPTRHSVDGASQGLPPGAPMGPPPPLAEPTTNTAALLRTLLQQQQAAMQQQQLRDTASAQFIRAVQEASAWLQLAAGPSTGSPAPSTAVPTWAPARQPSPSAELQTLLSQLLQSGTRAAGPLAGSTMPLMSPPAPSVAAPLAALSSGLPSPDLLVLLQGLLKSPMSSGSM